jgi:hypothetical protein
VEGYFFRALFVLGRQQSLEPTQLPAKLSGFFAQLLLAACRLLRRRLDLLSTDDEGDHEPKGAASAADGTTASPGVSSRRPGEAIMLGSELITIFEGIGLDATEPSLRAIEELIEESSKRHEEMGGDVDNDGTLRMEGAFDPFEWNWADEMAAWLQLRDGDA